MFAPAVDYPLKNSYITVTDLSGLIPQNANFWIASIPKGAKGPFYFLSAVCQLTTTVIGVENASDLIGVLIRKCPSGLTS